MTLDYGTTIHLPKTDFPRRAGLAQKEPEIQKRWAAMDLYARQRKESAGREKFILHFGPPFANGHIHLGHLLSKTLKDLVSRSQQMTGRDSLLVPGWDCHGLPIEWKIEEKYRAEGKKKNAEDSVAFRAECRAFAQGWVDVQNSEFQRIGVMGDWKNYYSTMHKGSEATIAKEIHKFLLNGGLYRGSKPVMWSVPEQTALAEAEVEYKDVTSDTIWVKFPVKTKGGNFPAAFDGASVVIWTTTPWTMPGNRAVAYGEALDYVMITVNAVADDSTVRVGDKLLVCAPTLSDFQKNAKITAITETALVKGAVFEGTVLRHPLHGKGYEFDVPLLAGDFVTTDAGTGFVHIAPGHGEDDYRLGLKYGIEVPHTVKGDGTYFETVPLFAGVPVYTAEGKKGPGNKFVTNAILEAGNLVGKNQIQHSYPHSWRSKAPVIFRNTPQWFISMEKNDLRAKALAEIKKTRWVPARGENRIASMVEQRGDWCVSRQRAWGVPIAIFVNKATGEPLKDEKVLDNIIRIFNEEGSDAWFARPASDFLGSGYKADDFEQIKDIIDVWFESGSTQGFVLENRPELHRPADLYLEGSDQHRGWFQSSLLVGCGTRGDAPFKAVLTHGFILDEKGYKMSKSTGNVTSPMALADKYGADILRLWAAGSDYTQDIKFGENILQGHVDIYRRVRNTFCYLLGSFADFDFAKDKVAYKDLGGMDQWILHRLFEIDAVVRQCIYDFDFLKLTTTVHNFCAKELSAFYFDICKDTLYCEALDSVKRRSVVTVLDHVFNHLVHWLAPVLCFTAEEAWLSYKGLTLADTTTSIHLSVMPAAPAEWQNAALAEKWEKVAAARAVVTGALEVKRAEKQIGASLEAAPEVFVADAALAETLKSVPFADVCITSGIALKSGAAPSGAFTLQGVDGVAVSFTKAEGQKCERCWKYTTDVGSDPAHAVLCARCAGVVSKELKAAA
ncbi:MAG: isoleucine--tRNA ligase [Micavibrio sp.]|nr:isoleucine--tRNA ligase [Micavibrio sp.]